jgi:uncharacterized membrane protein YedE/YeeE
MNIVISFIVGLLFALGLGISGMTDTTVVKGFLDMFGTWNLNLMGVMIGAILVHTIVYHLIKNKPSPLLDTKFHLPTNKMVDKKLIFGALIFGLGWGWAGICPGPGIVSLASGKTEVLIFIGSMVAGMYLFKFIEKKI